MRLPTHRPTFHVCLLFRYGRHSLVFLPLSLLLSMPQFARTYHSKLVGALSIPMMCMQSPGAIAMVLSIASRCVATDIHCNNHWLTRPIPDPIPIGRVRVAHQRHETYVSTLIYSFFSFDRLDYICCGWHNASHFPDHVLCLAPSSTQTRHRRLWTSAAQRR